MNPEILLEWDSLGILLDPKNYIARCTLLLRSEAVWTAEEYPNKRVNAQRDILIL